MNFPILYSLLILIESRIRSVEFHDKVYLTELVML